MVQTVYAYGTDCIYIWYNWYVHVMELLHIIMVYTPDSYIKTHGCVSAAKEDVWHTSVLFTRTAKSPFSTPHISITTGPISIKFTYFMPSIYMTLHTKFEENQFNSLRGI